MALTLVTEIIDAGRWAEPDYEPADLREALWKAFARDGMDCIRLRNSRRENPFLAASAAYGVDQGWLEGESIDDDEQDAGDVVLRLTPEGRTEFGLDNSS